MKDERSIRHRLTKHIEGGEAFLPIDKIVEEVSFDKLGIQPEGLPYSFFQLFYHIRYAQYDILEFSRNKNYQQPKWPDDYWPDKKAPDNEDKWKELVKSYFKERDEFCELLSDKNNDLLKPFSHGSGQTLFREALLIIEHNAYHTGQLLVILRLLDDR